MMSQAEAGPTANETFLEEILKRSGERKVVYIRYIRTGNCVTDTAPTALGR